MKNIANRSLNLQAGSFLKLALIGIRLGVGSTNVIALAEDRAVLLLELLAGDLRRLLAPVHLFEAPLDRHHVNILLLAAAFGFTSERERERINAKSLNAKSVQRCCGESIKNLPAIEHLQLALR